MNQKDQHKEKSKLYSQDKIFKRRQSQAQQDKGREEMKNSKWVKKKSTKKNRIIDLRAEKTNPWAHIKPLLKGLLFSVLNLFIFHLLGSEHSKRAICLQTSPYSPLLGSWILTAKKFLLFWWNPLSFAILLTIVNNLSLFLPLLLVNIYRCISVFSPSKCAYSIPLIPAAFKLHDFEKTGKERQGSSLWSFAYLQYQCLLNNEEGQARPGT